MTALIFTSYDGINRRDVWKPPGPLEKITTRVLTSKKELNCANYNKGNGNYRSLNPMSSKLAETNA